MVEGRLKFLGFTYFNLCSVRDSPGVSTPRALRAVGPQAVQIFAPSQLQHLYLVYQPLVLDWLGAKLWTVLGTTELGIKALLKGDITILPVVGFDPTLYQASAPIANLLSRTTPQGGCRV